MKNWILRILIFLRIKKAFIFKPSDYELELLKNAYIKNFKPTIESLNSLAKGGIYKIKLTYTNIDGKEFTNPYKVNVTSDKLAGLKFKIVMPEMPNVPGVKYKESYGLAKELLLSNKKSEFFIPEESVSDFETEFPARPQILEGRFTNIKSLKHYPSINSYYRLVIPIKEKELIYPTDILDCENNHIRFDIPNWDRQKSLIGLPFMSTKGMYSDLSIKGKKYHFFAIEQMNSYVIDSIEPISIVEFKKATHATRLSFAFLSGKYYKEEYYILSSSKPDFSIIDFFEYKVEGSSVITENQIIKPTFFFKEYERMDSETQVKWKEYHKMFDSKIFSQICEKVIDSPEFARGVELIVNAGNLKDPVQKGALYSVSIETITDLIRSENEDTFRPIPKEKKIIWKQIRVGALELLEKNKNEISKKGYTILKSKIENLNSPTNRDKLEKPFKLLGIELTDEEKEALNNRNDYLHGGQPDDREWTTLSNLNALMLHYLIGMLILKYFKYKGHYLNVAGWFIIHDFETKNLVNKIEFDGLKTVLKKVENNDFKNLEEIEEAEKLLIKVEKFGIAAQTIKDFIKII